uniref:Activator of Hsp90 ATPase AHSA1-like N-terminal domain-containing protein n=1 Tax=Globisporangium ultimum (strain ATCC 200006 / CBS 805.95 / DAOM BR144) TaxID=431595 RepID=K3WL21_GLOUD
MSDNEQASPKKAKKIHNGYHGWMKSIAKTEQDFTPVRIESTAGVAAPTQQGNSVWNSAGTWEEKDKSEWARARLKERILDSFSFVDGAHKVSIKANSIVKCDGEAKVLSFIMSNLMLQIVFSRGKKRCGYDISLKFEWTSTRADGEEDPEGADEVTGHVEVHDFDDTSGEDYEIKVTTGMSRKHDMDAKKSVLKWEPELRKILTAWKEELLQQ